MNARSSLKFCLSLAKYIFATVAIYILAALLFETLAFEVAPRGWSVTGLLIGLTAGALAYLAAFLEKWF